MNELIEYLQSRYDCEQTSSDTFAINLPIFYPNSEQKISLALKLNENTIVLSDAGEFVENVCKINPEFDFFAEDVKYLMQKYNIEFENGKVMMTELLGDFQFAISNFINFACVILYMAA